MPTLTDRRRFCQTMALRCATVSTKSSRVQSSRTTFTLRVVPGITLRNEQAAAPVPVDLWDSSLKPTISSTFWRRQLAASSNCSGLSQGQAVDLEASMGLAPRRSVPPASCTLQLEIKLEARRQSTWLNSSKTGTTKAGCHLQVHMIARSTSSISMLCMPIRNEIALKGKGCCSQGAAIRTQILYTLRVRFLKWTVNGPFQTCHLITQRLVAFQSKSWKSTSWNTLQDN